MSAFITNHPRAPELIRIGEEAIAKGNDALRRQYFAADYVFHGPGSDLDFEALRAYFASMRDAFSDLRITRAMIIGEGDYLAARTMFSGVFTGVFTMSPVGRLEPHGQALMKLGDKRGMARIQELASGRILKPYWDVLSGQWEMESTAL